MKDYHERKENMLRVGVITGAHGIKGEVKVFPTTDDPKRFKKLKDIFIDDGKTLSAAELTGARLSKNMVIASIAGITDRDMAESLRKRELLIDRSNAVKLSKDEYFISDLTGLRILDEDGNGVGVLKDVITTGANDVYEIKLDENFLYGGVKPRDKMLYLPAIKECVLSVDIPGGEIKVRIMKGLIE
jgi:16S rRNA processing protein RimM